jgi:hypothetical protein
MPLWIGIEEHLDEIIEVTLRAIRAATAKVAA